MIDRTLRVERSPDPVPADLLLPARIVQYAVRLKKRQGEWRDLIVYLTDRHRARVLQLADAAVNVRFRYQVSGQGLLRICYVPYRDMVVELRMLSFASRMSMCALVVLMLEWEQQGEGSPELDRFIGSAQNLESAWRKAGSILVISAALQMSCTPDPPETG